MKIIEYFNKHKNMAVLAAAALTALLLVIAVIITNIMVSSQNEAVEPVNAVNPTLETIIADLPTETITEPAESTVEATTEKKESSTAASTTVKPTSATQSTTSASEPSVPFATDIKPQTPADYNAQWEKGYLVAIDNPDTTYACAQVTLSDEDRDLLERLCYGEFGSGGFIGAAMIAQSVKDAMCFDGIPTVADVIRDYRYTGSTTSGTSDECRQAVRYIFDENHDAVQHRLMYMYNPYMVQSNFHESQNFILSYQGVRFFDRWGY